MLHSSKSKLVDLCRAHLAPVDMLETSEGKVGVTGNDLEGPIGKGIGVFQPGLLITGLQV